MTTLNWTITPEMCPFLHDVTAPLIATFLLCEVHFRVLLLPVWSSTVPFMTIFLSDRYLNLFRLAHLQLEHMLQLPRIVAYATI